MTKEPCVRQKRPTYDKIYPSDQDHLREYRKSPTLYQKSPMMENEPYT